MESKGLWLSCKFEEEKFPTIEIQAIVDETRTFSIVDKKMVK